MEEASPLPTSAPPKESINISDTYQGILADCSVCQWILQTFQVPFSEEYDVNLGPSDLLLSPHCAAHSPLFFGLERSNSQEWSDRLSSSESSFESPKPKGQLIDEIELVKRGAAERHVDVE
ncbi:hypothetical protein G7Y89_g10406 [Cudoniella acicularis]|uniref:Uncharacterized protein n=1 Tax=Cudoniella acicularis TaxID=354080 RepID=A0A8H4VZ29_9HELO|nr:hypothetical protein G7Y89_g10406 [Cudoniella acicularis]